MQNLVHLRALLTKRLQLHGLGAMQYVYVDYSYAMRMQFCCRGENVMHTENRFLATFRRTNWKFNLN